MDEMNVVSDKVKFTKNEYVLALIFENVKAANILGLEGRVYEQYIALRHCFAIVKNVLNDNLLKGKFDMMSYEVLCSNIIVEIDKYNNLNVDGKVRQMAYNKSRGLCLEFYEKLMGDLFKSGMIFTLKEGQDLNTSVMSGMDE